MKRLCALSALALLVVCAPSSVRAEDDDRAVILNKKQTYTLTSRQDWQRRVPVTLEVTESTPGSFAVVRRTKLGPKRERVIFGKATRRGNLLRVRFDAFRGARSLLTGRLPRPLLGIYRLGQGSIRGMVYDPERNWGWNFCVERGKLGQSSAKQDHFSPPGKLRFKRVVICLDGIPHRVLTELKQAGHFAQFTAPGRLISVFPSLSSISWNSILGMPPEPGYQAVYYANALNKSMGVTMRKMKGSRFQTRMHVRHTGIVGHAMAYVMPFGMGKRQLRHMIRELIHFKGARTAFMYAYQTDPIAHMNGKPKLVRILKDLDNELNELQKAFKKKHGEKLEIVIVSDHGHTLVSGELVKLDKHLKKHGWKVVKKVKKKNQASFTTAGILASIALHCQERSEPELARLVSKMNGVDVCTYDVGGRQQYVVNGKGVARFDYDAASNRYAYKVLSGRDPIGYTHVYAALAAKGQVDGRGYAASRDLFKQTVAHRYPDAPARIRRGHTVLVRNPANVLVSLKDGFENGAGLVKLTARLRGRSGTHGALNQNCSGGVFMTNYMPTVPAIRTRDFAKYVDLSDYMANDPPMEVSVAPKSESLENANPEDPKDEVRDGMWLEVKDEKAASASKPGWGTTVDITVKRARFLIWDKKIWSKRFSGRILRREANTWIVPLNDVLPKLKEGKTYVVHMKIVHRDERGKVRHSERRKVKVRYRGTYQIFD